MLHESRDLRLDVGETYAWSLSAGLVQLFELERLDDTGPPRVRLTVVQNEVLGEAQAFLSAEEARAFARMLTTWRATWTTRQTAGCVVRRPRSRTVLAPGQPQHGQYDPARCPSWCGGAHLDDSLQPGGYYHDSPDETVTPTRQVQPGVDDDLNVRLSQYVPAEGEPGPVRVELQDQHRTLALLTPLEAVNFARALLSTAERALS